MKSQHPTLSRVISTDYPSFIAVLFPVVFDIFTIYFFFTGNYSFQFFLPIAIVATIIGVPFLVKRYRIISSVFEAGIQTKGTVTNIGFFRGRGSVSYSYNVQGETQTSSNAINRNSHTRKLTVGQKVTVVVDRDDPKRAFIWEIYL